MFDEEAMRGREPEAFQEALREIATAYPEIVSLIRTDKVLGIICRHLHRRGWTAAVDHFNGEFSDSLMEMAWEQFGHQNGGSG